MAVVTHGSSLPDSAGKSDFYGIIDNATVSSIADADISSGASIQDSKLNTISTAGKVNVSALTGQVPNANLAQLTTAALVSGSALTNLANTPSGAGVIPGANLPLGYIKVSETQTQNTSGGTATTGSWQTRVLNTKDSDTTALASLNSNQVTIPAGTYIVKIRSPFCNTSLFQTRLQNITDSTTTLIGSSGRNDTSSPPNANIDSNISGLITLASSKAFSVQYQCGSTGSTIGLGSASNFTTEVYTVAEFIKIA